MNAREANEAMLRLQHAAGGDPYGVRTLQGARAAYVRGDIDVAEFERRAEIFLSGQPIAILEPGERVISIKTGA